MYQFGFKNRSYEESRMFMGNGFTMQIVNSYITDKTNQGELINDKSVYVLISMNIQNNYSTERKFDTARPVLVIDGKKYYSDIEKS